MAPEQFLGAPASAAIDLYRVAAIFFQALTGRPLHDVPVLRRLRDQIRHFWVGTGPEPDPVEFIRELRGGANVKGKTKDGKIIVQNACFAELGLFYGPVLARALEPSAEDRYASAQEMLEAVDQATADTEAEELYRRSSWFLRDHVRKVQHVEIALFIKNSAARRIQSRYRLTSGPPKLDKEEKKKILNRSATTANVSGRGGGKGFVAEKDAAEEEAAATRIQARYRGQRARKTGHAAGAGKAAGPAEPARKEPAKKEPARPGRRASG
jgi:hypothetical protein